MVAGTPVCQPTIECLPSRIQPPRLGRFPASTIQFSSGSDSPSIWMISIPVFGAASIFRARRCTTRITSATYASSVPAYATQPTNALTVDIQIATSSGASTPPCRVTPGSTVMPR